MAKDIFSFDALIQHYFLQRKLEAYGRMVQRRGKALKPPSPLQLPKPVIIIVGESDGNVDDNDGDNGNDLELEKSDEDVDGDDVEDGFSL